MRDDGQDIGERVDRRFLWFERPNPRPHIGSHSQPHGDELSPGCAKVLTFSGLHRSLERHFTIGQRGGVWVDRATTEHAASDGFGSQPEAEPNRISLNVDEADLEG